MDELRYRLIFLLPLIVGLVLMFSHDGLAGLPHEAMHILSGGLVGFAIAGLLFGPRWRRKS